MIEKLAVTKIPAHRGMTMCRKAVNKQIVTELDFFSFLLIFVMSNLSVNGILLPELF